MIRQGCNTPDETAMWTRTTWRQHSRSGLRYGSDLTDGERTLLAPFLPAKANCGRKRAWPMREIVNAMWLVSRPGARSIAGSHASGMTAPGKVSTITW